MLPIEQTRDLRALSYVSEPASEDSDRSAGSGTTIGADDAAALAGGRDGLAYDVIENPAGAVTPNGDGNGGGISPRQSGVGSGNESLSDLSDSGDEDHGEDDLGAATDGEEREYTGSFEGPEKTLEVCFLPGVGDPRGCRRLTRPQLDQICQRARCTIISQMSNAYLDAYVLSESSLFVYPHKVLIKTCGTTTLLRCIATLLQHAVRGMGMQLEWVGYSRKNFTFPGDQLFPHSSFEQELAYLRSHAHLSKRLDGAGHVLGPVTGDHWFVYVADKASRPNFTATDRTINIMMFDMHPEVAACFYKARCSTGRQMTEVSGIASLVPGAQVDDTAFEPCGYSMNALLYESYYTVHVTPEEACSYASFETNHPFKSYRSMVNNVLNVFRPKRFVITMMADKAGLATMAESPFETKEVPVPRMGTYVRTSVSSIQVEGDCCCIMGNWDLRAASHRGLGRERSLSHC